MKDELNPRFEDEYFDNPLCVCYECPTKFKLLHREYGCVACNPDEDEE